MKKHILLVSVLLPLFSLPQATLALDYRKIQTPAKQIIHLLEVNPKHFEIKAVHAGQGAFGRQPLNELAKQHGALAAINGGFFKGGNPLVNGLPAGILKIQGQWYGIAYQTRAAIGWSAKTPACIDRIQTKTHVYMDHKKWPVQAMNQPPSDRKSILYSDAYTQSIALPENVYGLTLQNHRLQTIQLGGPLTVPKGAYVYTLPKRKAFKRPVEVGQEATVHIEAKPYFLKENYLHWQQADNIVGGAPMLIENGKIIKNFSAEKLRGIFVKERYARTAVGLLKNGHWLLVVVEQSAVTNSPGMSIPELAVFMKNKGCEYALNLDGGNSSTFYMNQKVMNHPDGEEIEDEYESSPNYRPIADAILVFAKNKK